MAGQEQVTGKIVGGSIEESPGVGGEERKCMQDYI